MGEEEGSHLFSEAIRSLEAGDNERAEQQFRSVLTNLDKKHHLAILSLKSLVTICSNAGELEQAIDWSLQLLEAQSGALGHTHADVSRTVMNIATMCETLGKHDLAKEVKELHNYASTAERSQKAQAVKSLRDSGKRAQEESAPTADEENATLATYLANKKSAWQNSTSAVGTLVTTGVCIMVVVVATGLLGVLKLCYKSEHNKELVGSRTYSVADDRVQLIFATESAITINIDAEKSFQIPFNTYGYSAVETGDLLLRSPFEKEYWLMRMGDELLDGQGRLYLPQNNLNRVILTEVVRMKETADYYYDKHSVYPDKLEQLGDYVYENPFTLRKDYPIMQVVNVPNDSEPAKLVEELRQGTSWLDEPVLYPGCINVGHISNRTNASVPETLIIHACDERGQFFKQSNGKPYLVVLNRGSILEPSGAN